MPRQFGKLALGLTAITALLLSACPWPILAKTPTTSDCWFIKQESCTIGVVRLYITDHGLKWESPKLGLTLVVRAPNWNLIAYNPNNKKFMQLTAEQLHQMANRKDKQRGRLTVDEKAKNNNRELPFEKIKTKTVICGVPTIEFHIPERYNTMSGRQQTNEIGPLFNNVPALSTKFAKTYDPKKWRRGDEDCWVASNIVLPKKAVELLAQKFGWPNLAGMHPMLRSVHIGDEGQCSVAFDTVECKRVPFTSSMFELPKGYSHTDNEMSLMMGINDEDLDVLSGSEHTPPRSATVSASKSAPLSTPRAPGVAPLKPAAGSAPRR